MSISQKLEVNLVSLFDWGFVNKGGYINVNIDQSGAYVDNRSLLTRITDPRSPTTAYYQGNENWVYESGQSSSPAPFVPPLIYVNGTLDISPIINYRDGRVTPSVSTNAASIVKAKHSYKWVNFTLSRNSFFRRHAQYNQARTDIKNGDISIPPEIRTTLPCVAIDVSPISTSRPFGMEWRGPRIYSNSVSMYVIGESSADVMKICDFIAAQKGNNFYAFDPSLAIAANDFPLNMNGTINSGKNHDQLSADYPWCTIRVINAESLWSGYLNENLYQAIVKIQTEITACLSC